MIKNYIKFISEELVFENIDIDVKNKNDGMLHKIISEMSMIVTKKKNKAIKIKKISGDIDKEIFKNNTYYHNTELKLELTNKDIIFAEYIDTTKNIRITINENLVYDLCDKNFDKEVLIEKMIAKYKDYLINNKFKIR